MVRWFTVPAGQPEQQPRLQPGAGLWAHLSHPVRVLFSASEPDRSTRPVQRLALMAITVILFGVAMTSHQLTPMVIVAGIAALALFRRCTARGLPILMATLTGTWIIFMAVPFLWGNATDLMQHVGQLTSNVDANVGSRLTGTPGHLIVIQARIAMSVAIWSLALLGGLRRLRAGYGDLSFALLAITPFSFLALQNYGGEMLNRVYFFVLPLMAFFAAGLFYRTLTSGRSWWTTGSVALITLLLLGGFFLTRYGNEQAETFTAPEVAAMQYLYHTAKPGALFLASVGNLPWEYQDFETFHYDALMNLPEWNLLNSDKPEIHTVVAGTAWAMRPEKHPDAYLILTRSEETYIELFRQLPPGVYEQYENAVRTSPLFTMVYSNSDAEVFALTSNLKGAGN